MNIELFNEKTLIIVESPTKVKTVQKFISGQYNIQASKGHIVDLPSSVVGIDLDNTFLSKYEYIYEKIDIINSVKNFIIHGKIKYIFIAVDVDREGEAIAFHLANLIFKSNPYCIIFRVKFLELTRKSLEKSFKSPQKIDFNLVYAQQTRRILDRLVGFFLSPFLWNNIFVGLSAGRVQSVALYLIVLREHEYLNSTNFDYWIIETLSKSSDGLYFESKVISHLKSVHEFNSFNKAKEVKKTLEHEELRLKSIKKTKYSRNPSAPYNTVRLQQEASRYLKFSIQKTMTIAQSLYEGVSLFNENIGLITYMRTDSTYTNYESVAEVRKYIKKHIGSEYVSTVPLSYMGGGLGFQGAHEAIRPTFVKYEPDNIKYSLSLDQYALYRMIWAKFVSSQMMKAFFWRTEILFENSTCILLALSQLLEFDGFLRVQNTNLCKIGRNIEFLKGSIDLLLTRIINKKRNLTKRFNESSLVHILEKSGIGRPSTYANILFKIQNKKYVDKLKNGHYVPTELGVVVISLLQKTFSRVLDISFTAAVEKFLDKIEVGEENWINILKRFYNPFYLSFNCEKNNKININFTEEETIIFCRKCNGSKMVIRWGRFQSFLRCATYPICKNIISYRRDKRERLLIELYKQKKCFLCQSFMVLKKSLYGPFWGCINYPNCKFTQKFLSDVKCMHKECTGYIIKNKGAHGNVFFRCSNYLNCGENWKHSIIYSICPICLTCKVRKVSNIKERCSVCYLKNINFFMR
ncbi:MAG: type I DNA topoisomerase [Deltaproteobacteria bacterium]|nr:MAG: type I DNA topoisomerase [Deltaproteobacteria bacterium]